MFDEVWWVRRLGLLGAVGGCDWGLRMVGLRMGVFMIMSLGIGTGVR